jgi:hypothetical protein
MRGRLALLVVCAFAALPAAALASFPYEHHGSDPTDYRGFYLASGDPRPNDLTDARVWMYASTPSSPTSPLVADKRELNGVRGASVVDADGSAPQAWATTTGRPDVTIAVLDSGVMWNNLGKPLADIRLKTKLNAGELPLPQADRTASTDSLVPDCSALQAREGQRDLNGDGVYNILDYACDSRVDPNPAKGVGPVVNGVPLLDPEDLIIAFSNGDDADHNGYVDDIAGWDFLDNDNDPFDDVQYGHGSGEVGDSSGEADNANQGGGNLGTCPNCMVMPLRVGTSFVADVNRFALATLYATDNGVNVVQEALGTLNKSRIAGDAIKYAYDHGTTVIASAADEAAQHHNWPSSYPYSIVVNSVTHTGTDPVDSSYLEFNGCTNFSSRVTVAIPSVSCSSDATGRGAGMAGLIYSAALDAKEAGKLSPHPTCRRVDGTRCVITPNEVRQLMASGTLNGVQSADDVDFAQDPATGADTETSCFPGGSGQPAVPGCTDPFTPLGAQFPGITAPFHYPARRGFDQFYGYGRVNMYHAVSWVDPASGNAEIPPEVEVTSPNWFEMLDPGASTFDVKGQVYDRGHAYTCKLLIAPGSYPKDTEAPDGDFVEFPSPGVCDGSTQHTGPIDGVIASVNTSDLKALFPATAGDFTGPEGGTTGQTPNPGGNLGRPNDEPYAFTVKVVATTAGTDPAHTLTGTDRRQAYLHHDADLLPGFPKQFQSDIEASPVLADLDGDNRNELIIANSDGEVHAYRRDGTELPGWPFHTDRLPDHPDSPAISSGAVAPSDEAVLATPAVGDLNHDGTLDVVVADMAGNVYVIDGATGKLEHRMQTNPAFSGAPLHPFENQRGVGPDGKFDPNLAHLQRVQHGFIGAPVLADLDQNDGGKLEIIAAALDGHVYAWNSDGSDVPGWPIPVVDHSKLRAQQPQFSPDSQLPYYDPAKDPGGDGHDQGAIVDTPAVGDLDGDGKPEVIVGTNENYGDGEGGESFNGGGVNTGLYSVLGQALGLANGRLYAIKSEGDPDGDPNTGAPPYLPGWPFKVGILERGVLPLVGEGITGDPVIGNVPCQGTTEARRVGVIPAAGVGYIVDKNGQSCYGQDPNGHDIALNTEGGAGQDQPLLPAFGHPAFAKLAGGTAFLAPAAGLMRAADVVLPEYQGGQDYLVAWDLQSPQGTIKSGWPSYTNDLQFLTGPSVADISPLPGEEVVEGSANDDFQGMSSAGTKLPGWPKLSGDWAVANPAIGSFGQLETDPNATRVVVDGTRNGRLVAYDTGAAVCGAASWPEFHHDPANSGDLDRDAISPGVPTDATVAGGKLTFSSPGDDLLCGTPKSYDVRTSDSPITPENFADADPVAATGDVVAAGSTATLGLPSGGLKRYVAVRAVDDQNNVGRPAAVEITPDQASASPPDSPGEGSQSAGGGGGGTSSPGGSSSAPSSPTGTQHVLADRQGCLPKRMGFKSRGLGTIRLGDTRARTLLHVGRPPRKTHADSVWTYCVRGGKGRVALVFVHGAIRLIASTATGHEATGRAGAGDRVAKLRRVYPGASRYGLAVYFTHRSSRIVFLVRRGRVRVAAVVDRRAIKNPHLLRTYLKLAGL